MRFKQNAISVLELRLFFILLITIVSAVVIMEKHFDMTVIITLTVTLISGFFGNQYLGANHIEISEKGILCSNKKAVCWEIQWSEIADIKQSSRFRHPAMIIVPNNDFLSRNKGVKKEELCFQLSGKARRACNHYRKTESGPLS